MLTFNINLLGDIDLKLKSSYGGSGKAPMKELEEFQKIIANTWDGGNVEKFLKFANYTFASQYNLYYDEFTIGSSHIYAYKNQLYICIELIAMNKDDDYISLEFSFEPYDGKNYIEAEDY
jgi:hypothetical protein